MKTPNLPTYVSVLAPMISALAAISNPASAQQPMLEEVIVTAQKRAQSLSDVPISVSAVGGEKMANAGILDLADLSAYVPNFQKADTSIGSYITIRGIGSGINQGFEQSVVQYVDDIALGRSPLARVPFVDLNRIEVLRGPQNVLFGKNSIGGALSMVTNKPTDELSGNLMLQYEPEYNTRMATGVISGPFSDTLRGRLAVRLYDDEGYFDNNFNGNEEANREDQTIRAILSWDISDTVNAELKAERTSFELNGRSDEIAFAYANPVESDPFFGLTYPQIAGVLSQLTGQDIGSDDGKQNFKRNTNLDEVSELDSDNVTLTVNWDADAFTLTSITGYLAYETDETLDTDGSGVDAFTQTQKEEYSQFSQEIRFTSPGGETIDWIAGLYYQEWDLDFEATFLIDDENLWSALGALGSATGQPGLAALSSLTNLLNIRDYEGDSKSYAAFAQATWNINQETRLTLGGRYTQEDKTASRSMNLFNTTTGELDLVQAITMSAVFGIDFANLGEATGGAFPIHDLKDDRSEGAFTPSATFEWDVSDSTMLYVSGSTGFKAGGFDARGNLAKDFQYEDESVIAFELGAKSQLLDGRLELNAALYYGEYDDMQVSQFDGTLGFVVGNAAEATSQGLELDGRWLLADGLTWTFGLAYLDFEFGKYENGTCPTIDSVVTGESLCDYTGKRNIYTPEWSGSTSLDYVMGMGNTWDFHATLDLNYKDDHFVDATLNPDIEQEGYTKVNARLALESENWMLALIGKNLTDKDVTSFYSDTPLSGTLNAPAYTGYMERPRTIAIQASYRF